MTLKEMIDRLRITCEIEIRDGENYFVCTSKTNSRGVDPYLDKEVVEWFVSNSCRDAFCVCLALDGKEGDQNNG